MRTKDFVKTYCVGTFCPDFSWEHGCHAYDGEECDEAWCAKPWRGKAMRDRVDEYCHKKYGKEH